MVVMEIRDFDEVLFCLLLHSRRIAHMCVVEDLNLLIVSLSVKDTFLHDSLVILKPQVQNCENHGDMFPPFFS